MKEKLMTSERGDIGLYQKLICDIVCDITDSRFLRQIYSIILREYKKDRA